MNFIYNAPFNNTSLGQVSIAIARSFYRKGLSPHIFPIGPVDVAGQKQDAQFNSWLGSCINNANVKANKNLPAIKLWHIHGALEGFSKNDSRLLTFHETSNLTEMEFNILSNQDRVYVTSRYTKEVFEKEGLKNVIYAPLGFDSHNFRQLENRPKIEGVTSFFLGGKAEMRKNTYRQLSLWAKKYGNNKKYKLNVSITNQHLPLEQQNNLIARALEGKQYWNINFINFSPTNEEYNVVLQSSDIILSCSSSECFDLPTFQATAMGAWPVALNAHVYKDYLNNQNAVLINPSENLIECYDGIFFRKGQPINQGLWHTFSDEDFYKGLAEAEIRLMKNGVNKEGMKLQNMTFDTIADSLIDGIN